jgi:hypothetical protein
VYRVLTQQALESAGILPTLPGQELERVDFEALAVRQGLDL